MHFIPGLRLRVSEETEIVGIDEMDMGEYAYDYVGLDLELKPLSYNTETNQTIEMARKDSASPAPTKEV